MANIVKFIGQQITMNTTPTSVGSATLVRINNTNANTNHVITQKLEGGDTVATFTLMFAGGDESFVYLYKPPTDTLEADDSSGDIVAVQVAFY